MIENDEQFKEVLKKYIKSKNIDVYDDYPYPCGRLECEDCVLNDVMNKLSNFGYFICVKRPFQTIEKYEEAISALKEEIEVIESWERENSSSAKETWEEEEKIYAEIQRLIAKNGELTKEISRLYSKLDQMEKGEK